jgi:hypothetical protein
VDIRRWGMIMRTVWQKQHREDPNKVASVFTVIFFGVGAGWMLIPDELFVIFASSMHLHASIETIRYIAFVFVIGATLDGLLREWASIHLHRRSATDQEMRPSNVHPPEHEHDESLRLQDPDH